MSQSTLNSNDLSPKPIWSPADSERPAGFASEFWQETAAMTKRLFIQLQRRPTTLVAGVLQPLMWLILFGALFYNAPAGLLGEDVSYGQFLAPGVIVFTAFSGALNAGLPVMFDREFGFLNRLLVAPLASRFSIVAASTIYIIALSFLQTAAIVAVSAFLGASLPGIGGLLTIAAIVFLVVVGVTALSLGLTFALPGHIELIAVIFVTNLPLLFASTALAPLEFMADWLKVVAVLNPLTYAIEPIRHLYASDAGSWSATILQTPWLDFSFIGMLAVLLAFDAIVLLLVQPLLRRRIS
ncbi:MAG: ABC transporter permease [Cyanobacteria bacterium J06641_5]